MKYLPVLLVYLFVGCAPPVTHDRAHISQSLSAKTGQGLRPDEGRGLLLPASVKLDDGLSENEAVAIAYWNNAQFQADLAEVGLARGALVDAAQIKNPALSLVFWGQKQVEATLALPLDFFWKRPHRVAQAKLQVNRTAEKMVQRGLDLARDVLVGHAEWSGVQERRKLLAEEAALQSEIAQIVLKRLEAGAARATEEQSARIAASLAQEASIHAQRDCQVSESRLKTFLGLGLEKTVLTPVDSALEVLPLPENGALVDLAFAARPALKSADLAIQIAGRQIGWEKSQILAFTALLDASSKGRSNFSFESAPGFQMDLPIFNWNQGKVTQAQVALKQASDLYLAQKHAIAEEVAVAASRYRASCQALENLRKDALQPALKTLEVSKQAYALGAISYLELAEYSQKVLKVRLQEVNALSSLKKDAALLKHSLGFSPFTSQAPLEKGK